MGRLSNQDGANGWTDVLTIDYSDFTVGTDDTAQTFTYNVDAGDHVRNVAIYVETAFNDDAGGDELTLTVGDGADADGYITAASSDVHADAGATVTYVANSGALLDNENGKMYTAADTIDIVVTPNASTGQSYALNELNAGRMHILMDIARFSTV